MRQPNSTRWELKKIWWTPLWTSFFACRLIQYTTHTTNFTYLGWLIKKTTPCHVGCDVKGAVKEVCASLVEVLNSARSVLKVVQFLSLFCGGLCIPTTTPALFLVPGYCQLLILLLPALGATDVRIDGRIQLKQVASREWNGYWTRELFKSTHKDTMQTFVHF